MPAYFEDMLVACVVAVDGVEIESIGEACAEDDGACYHVDDEDCDEHDGRGVGFGRDDGRR